MHVAALEALDLLGEQDLALRTQAQRVAAEAMRHEPPAAGGPTQRRRR